MERKFTIFALFYFVFEGKFQVQAPRGACIRRGDLTEGFLRYDFGGLIFGGAYTWRRLCSEFYGILSSAAQGMQVLYIVCIYFNSLLELYIVLIKLCVNVYF